MDLHAGLEEGLAQMGLSATATTRQNWLAYLDLLTRWNRVHNLTAIRDPEKMLTHHLLDSLAVLPLVTATRLLDVGSGGGLPGIPLAIGQPDMQVTLVDSNQKKASFLRQAVAELGLANVTVLAGRVEQMPGDAGYDGIISRAFAETALFLQLTRHMLAPGGRWYVMKGVYPEAELQALPSWAGLQSGQEIRVPGLDARRHLLIVGDREA